MKKVFIVYHYVAHYREPVFRKLMEYGKKIGIDYVLVAGDRSNVASIKTVDIERMREICGARWILVKNIWFLKRFLWQVGLLSAIRNERPHAIIFLGNVYYITTWIGVIWARFLRIKILMWTHGFRRHESGLIGSVRTIFYKRSQILLLYGFKAKDLLCKRGIENSRLRVVYNSLDYKKQLSIRNKLLTIDPAELKKDILGANDAYLMVWSGRLELFKNLDFLLIGMSEVLNRIKNAKLIIIGDGPDRKRLKKRTNELKISAKVIFWGECYDENTLGKLFYMSDLNVHPGPVGLGVIHSLTYGTPVLINDDYDNHGPEFEAVTPGKNGAFFTTNSIKSFVGAVVTMSQSFNDPSVQSKCFNVIDRCYNPEVQAKLISDAVIDLCVEQYV